MIRRLEETYKGVSISIDNKILVVRNEFLTDSNVCSIDYVKINKTPLSYYLSQKTVSLYKRAYNRSGYSFPDYLYILTSITPGQECPEPYKEIINVGDHLTVQDQNYILFFKKIMRMDNNSTKNESWRSYCFEKTLSHEYDGLTEYSCFFSGMNIKKSHDKLREIYRGHQFFEKKLPSVNKEYKVDDRQVSYKWQGERKLKISIVTDGEMEGYIFSEQQSGTSLKVINESQY